MIWNVIDVVGAAIQQSSMFGIASILPERNMKAVLEGQAVAGVIASIGRIGTLATSPEVTMSAFIFFFIALAYLGMSMFLTWSLRRNAYFAYYSKKASGGDQLVMNGDGANPEVRRSMESMNNPNVILSFGAQLLQTIKEVWLHGLCALFALMITLCVFPALLTRVRPMNYNAENPDLWTGTYFIPVIVFLSFNVCDWIGRALAGFIKWPRRDQKWLLFIISVLRVGLIPIVLFMNVVPRYYLPVAFYHDAFPIIFVIVLAMSNGYLLTLSMMYGPTFASPSNMETAGVALTIYIASGLSLGVAISTGLALLI